LRASFGSEALIEAGHVYDHASVCPFADLFDLVVSAHVKLDAAAIDLSDYGFGRDTMANRRGCKVTNVDLGTDCAFARVKIASHCIQGCIL
jgi:hypothetical protein